MKKVFILFLSIYLFGFISQNERVVSANTTILNTDEVVRNIGGAVTFTMPSSPNNGQEHTFINHGTGNITVSLPVLVFKNNAITTIPYYPSQMLPGWKGGVTLKLYFNGTNWIQL